MQANLIKELSHKDLSIKKVAKSRSIITSKTVTKSTKSSTPLQTLRVI